MTLQTLWVQSGVVDATIPASTEMTAALGDGTLFTSATTKQTIPVPNANSGTVFTQWVVDTPLDADRLTQLATTNLVAVKIGIAGMDLRYELDSKAQADFQALAACIEAMR